MNFRKNNKGFSLPELIVVITIIAVLTSVLAPMFLKYVNNARVAVDIQNAKELASLVDTAIADEDGSSVANLIQGAGGTVVSNVPGLSELPKCRLNSTYVWKINSAQGTGVTTITLNNFVIYPNTDNTSQYYVQYYKP